jgi:hypothetical protein
MAPRAFILVLALALGMGATVATAAAETSPTSRISAAFTPERLGAATTVTFAFAISAPVGTPAALEEVVVGYPRNLGFATSGLGIAACMPAALEALGAQACPANSRMGHGDAVVEIPIGPEVVHENVAIEVFAAPSPDGYLHILAYVSGVYPILAQVLLSGVLLPGHLNIVIPPIPSLPAAPYVAVTHMRLTLGGHLVYYERRGSRNVAYRPPGVGLPRSCPHGGFAFAASFGFIDGSRSAARAAVPCPRR